MAAKWISSQLVKCLGETINFCESAGTTEKVDHFGAAVLHLDDCQFRL